MEGFGAYFEGLDDPHTGNAGRHDLLELRKRPMIYAAFWAVFSNCGRLRKLSEGVH